MKHPETKRIVPGARFAVMFIHGIVGTPNQFRNVINLEGLVPETCSVWNLRLPGHGYGVKEFGASSGKQWRNYVRSSFLELATCHEKVFVVGHSMGTLFALQLEQEFPDKTAGLFLLNVPLCPWLKSWGIMSILRLISGRVRYDHPREASIVPASGAEPTRCLWRYLTWIPRFLDLFAEIIRTNRHLTEPGVPYRIFQSRKDELVSNRSAKILRKKGLIHISELKESSHFYYPTEDKEIICRSFEEVICMISTKE